MPGEFINSDTAKENEKMQIVALSGKKGSGKSTLAGYLAQKLDRAVILSFAEPVRREVAILFGLDRGKIHALKNTFVPAVYAGDRADLQSRGVESLPDPLPVPPCSKMTVRELLQWWGTDIRRNSDPGYWDRIMEDRLKYYESEGYDYAVIDDLRFAPEVSLLVKKGAFLIRVEHYAQDKNTDPHISETDLDDFNLWDMRIFPAFGEIPLYVFLVLNHIWIYRREGYIPGVMRV